MRLPLLFYAIALAARGALALFHPDPIYPDSGYYVAVARSLAAGRGFVVDFIWNFVEVGGRLPAHGSLSIPSNAHWMPLASIVAAPFVAVLGSSPFVVLLPFVLIGAAAAPLTYLIARDAGLATMPATVAGLMAAVPGLIAPFLGQPDNFALYMTLGALALWLAGRGLQGDARAFVAGGFVVGLATLARNDGILLGVPFALGWLLRWRAAPPAPRLSLAMAAACLGGFLLVAGPWYLRQLAVFGTLSPSAARVLWISAYPQLFSIGGDPSPATFLAQGWEAILLSRLAGFAKAVEILAVYPFVLFLVPFVLVGAWRPRRSPVFWPWFIYGVVLLAFSALLSAPHVPYGTFLHSAVALAPHGYVLAVDGIAIAVAWVAARRPRWRPATATRNFTLMAVAVIWLAGAGAVWKASEGWGLEAARKIAARDFLVTVAQRGDVVMSPDPGVYWYYTGHPGVVTPADPIGTVEAAARAYGVRWLALERGHLVSSLVPVFLDEGDRPGWISEALFSMEARPGDPSTGLRVYAVCFDPSDARPACQAPGP